MSPPRGEHKARMQLQECSSAANLESAKHKGEGFDKNGAVQQNNVAMHNIWLKLGGSSGRPHSENAAETKENDVTAIKLPEMPQAVRELAAKNLDQAQAVCTQLLDGARKAQETMKTMTPAIPMLEGLSGVQERALKFAEQNIDAGFSLAKELSQAADLTEMLQIQNKHVQQLLHSFSAQTQELIPTAK